MTFTDEELERLIVVLINSTDESEIDGPLYSALCYEQNKRQSSSLGAEPIEF